MAGHALRSTGTGPQATGPTRRQTAAFLAVLVTLAAAAAASAYLVKPTKARAFDLYYGTVVLDDQRDPVALDLASGKPTVRLGHAAELVNAAPAGDMSVVPLATGTLLLNKSDGEFNMLDAAGLPAKPGGGGIGLGKEKAPGTLSTGIAAGDSAYIVRTGDGTSDHVGTDVFLVNQSTIASALSLGSSQARAYGSLTGNTALADWNDDNKNDGLAHGVAATANGDLWLLTGTTTRTLHRLSMPAGSDPGVTLTQQSLGTAGQVSALESATDTTSNAAGGTSTATSGDSVALAGPDGLRIFGASGPPRQVAVPGLGDTKQIVAASNAQRRFDFLYQSAQGTWTLVSSSLDGRVSTHPIDGVRDQQLVPPAQSGSLLYTMSDTGTMYQIGPNGMATSPGLPAYPVQPGEERYDYSGADVTARGLRVIFNNRPSVQAVVVFTDDSHVPRVVSKQTAVDLDSPGGIEALAAKHASPGPHPGGSQPPQGSEPTPNPTDAPAPQVDTAIDCANATQIPHQPTLILKERGSRSVQVTWTYPVLSPQDCLPSTYSIAVEATGGDGVHADTGPKTLTVSGQQGVNIGGLFPNTNYLITATAVINGVGTASTPLPVATSPEGPPAPTGVRTTVDAHGVWTVTWTSCAGAANCVPTDSWQVQPSFCDGLGLSNLPDDAQVIGDPTQRKFVWRFDGGSGLLGRGLSFGVVGVGAGNLLSEPASDGACTTSWARPDPAQLELVTGLLKPTVASGDRTSATATLRVSGDENTALGGVGATVRFDLLDAGGSVVATAGPGTDTTARFDNIRPGLTYRAQAVVTPPGHPEAATTIGPVPVQAAVSEWPDLALAASFDTGSSNTRGTLSVDVSGVSSAAANGEKFSLAKAYLDCPTGTGGQVSLQQTGFDPAAGALKFGVDRIADYGDCKVSLALSEDGSAPLVYGGGNSPTVSASVGVTAPVASGAAADWTAAWADDGSTNVVVRYQAQDRVLRSGLLPQGWKFVLRGTDPDQNQLTCGTAPPSTPGTDPPDANIAADDDCVRQHSTWTWTVEITYPFARTGQSPVVRTVEGTAPSQPPPPTTEPPPTSDTPTPTTTPPSTSDTPTPTTEPTTTPPTTPPTTPGSDPPTSSDGPGPPGGGH